MAESQFDVIIIGGGIIGCASAYYLGIHGLSVLVIEKDTIGANQASSGAVGLLSIDSKPFSHGPLREAAIFSRRTYSELSQRFKELYGNDLEHEDCGILRVARDTNDLQTILEEAHWHRRHVAEVDELTSQDVRKRWPQIEGHTQGAVFYPKDTQVTSSRVVIAFYLGAKKHGALFLEQSQIRNFEIQNAEILSVIIGEKKLKAKNFLLAAGSWSSRVSQLLGFDLPIEPVRGQLLIFQMKERFLSCPVTVGGAEYYYLIPKQDNHLYAGTTLERAGFDTSTTEEALDKIADQVTRLVPKVADLPIRGSWAGLRPSTPDNLPIIGQIPGFKNLWIASGHYRKGVLLAPWTGVTVADLLLGKKPEIPIEDFSPVRFLLNPEVRN